MIFKLADRRSVTVVIELHKEIAMQHIYADELMRGWLADRLAEVDLSTAPVRTRARAPRRRFGWRRHQAGVGSVT